MKEQTLSSIRCSMDDHDFSPVFVVSKYAISYLVSIIIKCTNCSTLGNKCLYPYNMVSDGCIYYAKYTTSQIFEIIRRCERCGTPINKDFIERYPRFEIYFKHDYQQLLEDVLRANYGIDISTMHII